MGAHFISRGELGSRILSLEPRAKRKGPLLKEKKKKSYLLSERWETLSFRRRGPTSWEDESRVSGKRCPVFALWGQGQKTSSRFPAQGPAPLDPAPLAYLQARVGRADSDLLGPDLRDAGSALRLRRVSAPLPPATRGAPWLRRAAPANQRCRLRPSLAPQPMSTPATGHRPRGGGGRRGGGRVRPPRAQEPGACRRNREGRERSLGRWKRRPRTPIKPEGSLSDGRWGTGL